MEHISAFATKMLTFATPGYGDKKPAPRYEGLVQQVEDIDRQNFGKQHCDV